MPNSIYRLVDGPFLFELCKEVCKINGTEEFDLNLYGLSFGAYRTVYYDALPVKKAKQTKADFEEIETKKLDFLNNIRAYPNMQVKDGITRLKTEGRKKDASEVLEQKGVDTWIAVDAVKYALTGVAEEIEIITADSDIYPVFEVIRETRAKGVLRYAVGRTKSELIFSADIARAMGISEVAGLANIPMGKATSTNAHVPFSKDFEFELDDARYECGKLDDWYVVNKTDKNGLPTSLKTDHYLCIISWLETFSKTRRWSDFDEKISRLKQAH